MVMTSAHECASAYVSPFGVSPFGSTSLRSFRPWLATQAKIPLRSILSYFASPTSLRSVKCHLVPRCHRSLPLACRDYFRCAPITHVNLRSRFASTSHSFGRILPRSSVGLASLRSAQSASFFGTIAFAPMIKVCLPLLLWRLRGRHYFFEIADLTVGYARVLSE